MSAWIIGLGVSAGYLINRNLSVKAALDNAVGKYNNAAGEATGGVTSAEIRKQWRYTDDEKYGDMNPDMPKDQMDRLHHGRQAAAAQVEAFDRGPAEPTIQGVMLDYDRNGV